MPVADIVVESTIPVSHRVSTVSSMFDVPFSGESRRKWSIDLPIEDKTWNVGVIHGSSGSGKTTLAENLFGKAVEHEWPDDRSILDAFPTGESVRDVVGALTQVGFSSPPNWMVPYRVLSVGEKFRADMARTIFEAGDEIRVVDEFTSAVNRSVAVSASVAVGKYARRTDRKLVLVSCHSDILEWLEPDWRYDMDAGAFFLGGTSDPKSTSASGKRTRASGNYLGGITI